MKAFVLAASAAAIAAANAGVAHADPFSGPYVGVEVAHEDYDQTPNQQEAIAVIGGVDFAVGPAWVIGAGLRVTVDGADDRLNNLTPGGVIQNSEVAIEDQWSLSARVGRVFGDSVLVFAEGGYERFSVEAFRTLRNQVCTPPSGCVISRTDFSFDDEMWTVGAGAEWAFTENLSLRGTYTYGDSDAFERNRFSLAAAYRF